MDSYQSSNNMPALASLSGTQIQFSSHHLSKSMNAKKPRWIAPSPKKSTMTQIITSKNNEVKNNSSKTTRSFESNVLKRKSSLLDNIDNTIKRLEALHQETTTTTSDSDTTITKIDSPSKRRKLSKIGEEFEDLCKPVKDVENTLTQSTLLQPFNRAEDIKIIKHFHKYMELLSRKDDLYIYQLLEMKYRFQRSAKFLKDRFLTEILPNLHVYNCLTLDEMVIFYDKADMLVPIHVQNMIREKFLKTTGHDIRSPEPDVIIINDSENEIDLISNENVTSSCSSQSSPIISRRRNKVLKLSSSISSDNSDSDSCNNTEVPCVVSSVSKELNSLNISNSVSHKSIETCQPVQDSGKRTNVDLCKEKICHIEDNKIEHNSTDREKESENVRNTCDTEEKSSDSVPLSPCLFESSEEEKESDSASVSSQIAKKQETNRATDFNKECIEHEEQVSKCFTKKSDNCNPNNVARSSQTAENDLACDNSVVNTDHTYVKLNTTDSSLDNVNLQEESDTSSTFSADTVQLDLTEQRIVTNSEQLVKSVSDKTYKNASTNTDFTKNTCTQPTTLGSNNIDRIKCTELDVIEVIMNGITHIFLSNTVADCNVKEIIEEYGISKNYVHIINKKAFERLKLCTKHRNHIDALIMRTVEKEIRRGAVIERMIEKDIKLSNTLQNCGYNLRKFLKDPRSGTLTKRKIQWFKKRKDGGKKIKRNKPEIDSQSTAVSTNLTPAKRAQQIKKIFGVQKRTYRKAKSRKQIKKTTSLSPLSDKSTAISSPESNTIDKNENTVDVLCKKHEPIKKKDNKTSESDKEMNKSTSEDEEFDQPLSTNGTSTSCVLNKPMCLSSDKPTLAETNINTSVTIPENNLTNPISNVEKDNPKRKSDNQYNKSTPSITEKSTSLAESSPRKIIASIKNNFDKCVYKKLQSCYPPKDRCSSKSEESNQSSTPVANKKVYLKINKTTGDVLGVRPVTDKKIISKTAETCKATSVTENVPENSDSISLNTTLSDSSSTVNTHINEQVSEKISLAKNVPENSESINLNTTLSDSSSTVNTHINEQVSETVISSSDITVCDLFSDHDSNSSRNETLSALRSFRMKRKFKEICLSTFVPCRKPGHTDELSVIKPKRTYARKVTQKKPPNILNTIFKPPDSSNTVPMLSESDISLPPNKPELPDSSDDSGLEIIASQLHLVSPIANTSCSTQTNSNTCADVIEIEDEPNCILDFLIDGIKVEKDVTTNVPASIPEPTYETVPANRDDVNLTVNALSTNSDTDSVWCSVKRIMSVSPIPVEDLPEGSIVVVKSKTTQTEDITPSAILNEHDSVQVKQELITKREGIKQEWIAENDSCDNYPEMIFDCANIKQEISILENNIVTSRYFASENFDPILPNENVQTRLNMSKKLKALVTEKHISINHLKPVSNTQIIPEQRIKQEYSNENE